MFYEQLLRTQILRVQKDLTVFLALSGYGRIKAVCKMLKKLTLGLKLLDSICHSCHMTFVHVVTACGPGSLRLTHLLDSQV